MSQAVGRAPAQPAFSLTPDQAAQYLRRIDTPHPTHPDATALRRLVVAHGLAVPFENLDVHAREPISTTDLPRLFAKVVGARRGGFCYELNGLFAALLEAVGYRVTIAAARVCGGGACGPLFDHMALVATDSDGAAWLVDVGFGRFAGAPLAWGSRAPQPDRFGTYQLRDVPETDLESRAVPAVDVLRDGTPQYRLEVAPRPRSDFAPTCWYHSSAPESAMTQSLICSRATLTGRVSIAGRRLIVTTDVEGAAEQRQEVQLAGQIEVLSAYKEHFGFELTEEPQVLNARDDAPFLA